MKAGLTSSIALHAAILGWAFLTVSAPKAFNVADVEALPVDVVPFDAVSHVQVGDKKAPAKTKPSPKPTERPTTDAGARQGARRGYRAAEGRPAAARPAASAESTEGGDPGRATSAAPAGCRRGAAEAGRGPRSRGEGHHRRVGRRPEREVAG
jgi:colicin import membrane protein